MSDPFLPPCRICGLQATGLHYGVNSCGGCKGFFARSLVRKSPYFCVKSDSCRIGKDKSRKRSCPKCRYDKCIEMGMSKDAIRHGRYTYSKRTQDTLEVKGIKNTHNSEEIFPISGSTESPLSSNESQSEVFGRNEDDTNTTLSENTSNLNLDNSIMNQNSFLNKFEVNGNHNFKNAVSIFNENHNISPPKTYELSCRENTNIYESSNNSFENVDITDLDQTTKIIPTNIYAGSESCENSVSSLHQPFIQNTDFRFEDFSYTETSENSFQNSFPCTGISESNFTSKEKEMTFSELLGSRKESTFDSFQTSTFSNMSSESVNNEAANQSFHSAGSFNKSSSFEVALNNSELSMQGLINERSALFSDNLVKSLWVDSSDKAIKRNNFNKHSACLTSKEQGTDKSSSKKQNYLIESKNRDSDGIHIFDNLSEKYFNNKGFSNSEVIFSFNKERLNERTHNKTHENVQDTTQNIEDHQTHDTLVNTTQNNALIVTQIPVNTINCETGRPEAQNLKSKQNKQSSASKQVTKGRFAEDVKRIIDLALRFDTVSIDASKLSCLRPKITDGFEMYPLKSTGSCSAWISLITAEPQSIQNLTSSYSSPLMCLLMLPSNQAEQQPWAEFDEWDLDTTIQKLSQSHEKFIGYDTNTIDESELKAQFDMCMEQCKLNCFMFGESKVLSVPSYFEIFDKTGLDVDGRRALHTTTAIYGERSIKNVVNFYKSIPGFTSLPLEDQMVLIKGSIHEYYMLGCYRGSDNDCRALVDTEVNHVYCIHDLKKICTNEFVEEMKKVMNSLRRLSLTPLQVIVLKAIVATAPDRNKLVKQAMVRKIHWKLINCLQILLFKSGFDVHPKLWEISKAMYGLYEFSYSAYNYFQYYRSEILSRFHLDTPAILMDEILLPVVGQTCLERPDFG